jgi:hypothetical protein
MYNNNTLRPLDSRGRVVIPKRIRTVYELENAVVEILTENELIILRKPDLDNPTDPKIKKRSKGTSGCNFCICSTCTGFGCPWIPKIYRSMVDRYPPKRCWACFEKQQKKIHDCDFYTPKKRKKFYRKKIVKQLTNHDKIMLELAELKGMLINSDNADK